MGRKDLSREHLYEAVKTLLETQDKHIHLSQQKLFTLFSVAFQYMLYQSTKDPGHYIIRIEDSYLADKLARKAKDETTRKFLFRMLLPRRLKYKDSCFHIDFFHVGTWNVTKDLPQDRIKGAIIVKNTSQGQNGDQIFKEVEEDDILANLPENYFHTTLTDICPKTITIAFGEKYEGTKEIKFPFIKESAEVAQGVRISSDINIADLE
jgi:hypothetical protein